MNCAFTSWEFEVFGLLIILRRWLRSNVNVQLCHGGAETAEVQHAAL